MKLTGPVINVGCQPVPIAILPCGHIFDVKNLHTDNTGLTDEHRFFSALQKNLDRFGDPPSCEAGKSCVYPILKVDYWVSKEFNQ